MENADLVRRGVEGSVAIMQKIAARADFGDKKDSYTKPLHKNVTKTLRKRTAYRAIVRPGLEAVIESDTAVGVILENAAMAFTGGSVAMDALLARAEGLGWSGLTLGLILHCQISRPRP